MNGDTGNHQKTLKEITVIEQDKLEASFAGRKERPKAPESCLPAYG